MSKAKALSLARRLYGRGARVRTVKNAPVGAERERLLAEHHTINGRLKALKAERDARQAGLNLTDLVVASQFVVDVNGDCPSIDQMADALNRVRADRDRDDEIDRLKKHARRCSVFYRRRCEVCNVLNGCLYVLEDQADTWPEVCDQLQAKLAEREAAPA